VPAGIDVRAWGIWLIAGLSVVFALDHPAVDLIVTVAAALVASTSSGRLFRTFLIVGLVLVLVRTILSALAGHTGDTILFHLPAAHLPALLGGAALGGAVTAEVVLTGLAEGARLLAVVACFGAFIAVTESIDVIRLLPRFLFEAGLVVNIAMAFAPQFGRTAREIREAQLMRGSRRRVAPVFVPVVASSLERATSLAESMDSRGYGRTIGLRSAGDSYLAALTAAGSLAAASSAALWAMGLNRIVTGLTTLLFLLVVIASLSRMSRLVPRVRYRRGRWSPRDWAVVVASALAGTTAVASSILGLGLGGFDPYQTLFPSPPPLLFIVLAIPVALPAVIVELERSSR
jgi:energy-coupling factor transport system permease protein